MGVSTGIVSASMSQGSGGEPRARSGGLRFCDSRPCRGGFASRKEYFLPDCLGSLRGPSSGVVRLPIHLFWQAGGHDLDLGDDVDACYAYQAVISEDTTSEQESWLCASLLERLWPSLFLPPVVAREWERRFPCLRGNPSATAPTTH